MLDGDQKSAGGDYAGRSFGLQLPRSFDESLCQFLRGLTVAYDIKRTGAGNLPQTDRKGIAVGIPAIARDARKGSVQHQNADKGAAARFSRHAPIRGTYFHVRCP